jgi:hypothetical protein
MGSEIQPEVMRAQKRGFQISHVGYLKVFFYQLVGLIDQKKM